MRKGLTISLIICIILCGVSQLLIPVIAGQTVETKLKTALVSDEVNVSVSSMPGILLLFGEIDTIHATAKNGMLGNIRCSQLVLDGKNVQADLSSLDVKDGSAITAADSLTLTATITQDDLQKFLQEKLGKVENLTVTLRNDRAVANGEIKLLGKKADVTLEGIFFEENGMVYFKMTHLDIQNAVLGRAVVGNFFGDILVLDLHSLAFSAAIESVEQKDGYVLLKANHVEQSATQFLTK